MSDPKIIVALDYPTAVDAEVLLCQLDPTLCKVKVGLELFIAEGSNYVKKLVQDGWQVFLDLKLHDIPNTNGNAMLQICKMGVWGTTVHASIGPKALKDVWLTKQMGFLTKIFAVTVLTSMDSDEFKKTHPRNTGTIRENVLHLSKLTMDSQLTGVVCSPQEIAYVHRLGLDRDPECGPFITICPGIRPEGCDNNDQSRTLTPFQATALGADYLVIGRPITQAENPLDMLIRCNEEIAV